MTVRARTQIARGGLTAPAPARVANSAAATDFEVVIYTEPDFSSDADNGNDALEYGRTTLRKVKAVYVTPDAAMTGATATESTLAVIKYDKDGANGVTVCSKSYVTGTDLTAFKRDSLGAISNEKLKAGETLTLKKTHTSTGTATPNLLVSVDMI